jgi:glycosyltransferase involved in cell wall biosynthesis
MTASAGLGSPDDADEMASATGIGSLSDARIDEQLLHGVVSRRGDDGISVVGERRRQTRPTVSIIIPALNEERNLPFVLPRIGSWVDEIILVAGDSNDRTCQVARALVPEIRVVQEPGKGKGAALRAGFEAAVGDIIVMLDADGSTDPSQIPIFLGALAAGADFVKGTRFAQGAGTADMSLLRRVGNRLLVRLVRLLFGGRCTDLCYGYIAFWRRVLPQLRLDAQGFEIETQMNLQALALGLRVSEVPSFEFRRIHGKSNLRTIPDGWRVLKTIFREWIRRAQPHHEVESEGSWRADSIESAGTGSGESQSRPPLASASR